MAVVAGAGFRMGAESPAKSFSRWRRRAPCLDDENILMTSLALPIPFLTDRLWRDVRCASRRPTPTNVEASATLAASILNAFKFIRRFSKPFPLT